jgi:DNA-binding Lrp family transcriptional regulator
MRAVLFITEHQRLGHAGRLYRKARKVRGVVEAYPCLGRYDGVVFVEAPDADSLNTAVVAVSRLPGVHSTDLHVEERGRPKKRGKATGAPNR